MSSVSSAQWQGWFDGAADPNPGPAAFGAVLRGPAGEVVEIARPIGHGTNNEAEYLGLIAVLEAAAERGVRDIVVRGDSQLVVNQANGLWAVRSGNLQEHCRQAKALMGRIGRVRLEWVPRERNTEADALSKKGLGIGGKTTDSGWSNLTAVGKRLGLSAIAVGKRLDAAGLRADGKPTAAALEAQIARLVEHRFGTDVHWHTERAATALGAPAP